jgi:hypothetical protein
MSVKDKTFCNKHKNKNSYQFICPYELQYLSHDTCISLLLDDPKNIKEFIEVKSEIESIHIKNFKTAADEKSKITKSALKSLKKCCCYVIMDGKKKYNGETRYEKEERYMKDNKV